MSPLKTEPGFAAVFARNTRAQGLDERGFSLIEVILATVIAVIAILGLAHSFASGRALVERYSVARAALGLAQQRLELLGAEPSSSPDFAIPAGQDSVVHSNAIQIIDGLWGLETWTVVWVDDPGDRTKGTGDVDPNDYKQVNVAIGWGAGIDSVSVRSSRFFGTW